MYSFFNKLFTVSGNNNTTCNKNRIGNRNLYSKLAINVLRFRTFPQKLIETFKNVFLNCQRKYLWKTLIKFCWI